MAKHASAKLAKSKTVFISPSISRSITEFTAHKHFFYAKIFIVSFISGFLLMAISMKGYVLIREVQSLHTAQIQRTELTEQLTYWENVVAKHSGYRDAYFKASVLAYQLGKKELAKQYLIEAMALDPNFKEGKVFGEKTGLL